MFFFIKRFFYIFFYKVFGAAAPQEGENIILERIFSNQKNGFYIDIGAHHPIRFSNTLNLYQRGWKGINIEPNVEVIKSFNKLRSRDININLAISSRKRDCNYYKFEDSALNTIDIEMRNLRIKQGWKYLGEEILKTKRLDEILKNYCEKNSRIDLLKIDVEGRELDVLKSNDWKNFIPQVIICELINVDLEKLTKNKVYNFLKSKNYLLYCKLLQNGIFFHKSFSKKLFKQTIK